MPAKTKSTKTVKTTKTPEKKPSPPKEKCKGTTALKKQCGAYCSKNKDHNPDFCAKHQDQAPDHVQKTKDSPPETKGAPSSVLPEASVVLLQRLDWNWVGNAPSKESLTMKADSGDEVHELTEENWKELEAPMKGVTRVVLVNPFKAQTKLPRVKETLFFEGEEEVSLLDLLNELHKEHQRLEKLYTKSDKPSELANSTFTGKLEVVTSGDDKHYHLLMEKTDFEEESEAETPEAKKEAPKLEDKKEAP